MAYQRFVNAEIVRLSLSHGDWIEIKQQLGVGDQKRIDTAGLRNMASTPNHQGATFVTDLPEFSFARTMAYLVAWSFTGADDKPVALSRDALEALTPETYAELENAITAHVEAQQASKKIPAGAPV